MEFNDSPDDNRDFPNWVLLNKIPCYVFKFLTRFQSETSVFKFLRRSVWTGSQFECDWYDLHVHHQRGQ